MYLFLRLSYQFKLFLTLLQYFEGSDVTDPTDSKCTFINTVHTMTLHNLLQKVTFVDFGGLSLKHKLE